MGSHVPAAPPATAASSTPTVPLTLEGSWALHQMMRIRHAAWRAVSHTDRAAIAGEAAEALRPLVNGFPNAGVLAEIIFAVGVIGVGLMSVPVLAGSSAYAIAETFGWREGLSRRFSRARGFYITIMAGTVVGMSFNFLGVDPIQALVATAVFNGLVAVPLILVIALVSSRKDVMGSYRSRFWSKLGLWSTFVVMAAAAVALVFSLL